MQTYNTKQDLIYEVETTFESFYKEFTDINEKEMHLRSTSVDKTPAEMLAYQIGRLRLLMSWEQDELAGKEVITPAPGMKRNQMGTLYQSFYDTYAHLPFSELLSLFKTTKEQFITRISSLDEQILF
jgi:hypothetical protein